MSRFVRRISMVIVVLMLAACSGAAEDQSAPSTTDESDAASGGGEESAASDVSTEGMQVAYASDLDPNDVADQFGIQEAGAEVTALTEDSAVAAGLNNGDFDIGNIDATAAIRAVQGGVPLTIVYVSQTTPEFVMVSQPEITDFDQLAGQTVAYHSPGSLTEIVQRELVRQNDPALEDQIDWTVLPESPNRASAMVADRIQATSLEFLDVAALQEEGDYNVLGSWGDLEGESANALATAWVVADSYLDENRDEIVAFLQHVQDGYDSVYEDKDAWTEMATETLPDVDETSLGEAYDYYTDVGMYPQSGEPPVTEQSWAGMDAFFRQIGEYDQTASPDMVDFEIVAEVSGN